MKRGDADLDASATVKENDHIFGSRNFDVPAGFDKRIPAQVGAPWRQHPYCIGDDPIFQGIP